MIYFCCVFLNWKSLIMVKLLFMCLTIVFLLTYTYIELLNVNSLMRLYIIFGTKYNYDKQTLWTRQPMKARVPHKTVNQQSSIKHYLHPEILLNPQAYKRKTKLNFCIRKGFIPNTFLFREPNMFADMTRSYIIQWVMPGARLPESCRKTWKKKTLRELHCKPPV